MNLTTKYKIPSGGIIREELRTKGQFWTPEWVADLMANYALHDKPSRVLDPAVGEGAFFRAAKRYSMQHGFKLELAGCDIDKTILTQAKMSGLLDEDLKNVSIKDFVLDPPADKYFAIIANPPYIRHHRLSSSLKGQLKNFAQKVTGCNIDGRAGFHVYFLIRALLTLAHGGRLAFIVSADICEGIFAKDLWNWIGSNFRLDAVVTFAEEAAPFPGVDTNAIIFLIQNLKPEKKFLWIKCLDKNTNVSSLLFSESMTINSDKTEVYERELKEALTTGLSRPPATTFENNYTLGDFATVMRGIATGDNDFFFLNSNRVKELELPDRFLVRAVGRMRDVVGENFDPDDLQRLDSAGRPTFLLNMNGYAFENLPAPLRKYILEGEARGLPEKTLIKTRNPWYRMESRKAPPILFAYLGRRTSRFILNRAGVVPLTCLLCVYPKNTTPDYISRLWKVLSHPDTINNLGLVGKSYGGGAIKVEPRALERLPLPDAVVKSEGLDKLATPKQIGLFETL